MGHPNPSLQDMLTTVRVWFETVYPYLHLKSITCLSENNEKIKLLVPRSVSQTIQTVDDGSVKGDRCAMDILEMLQEVGHPLTTTRIMFELAKRGKEWSDRKVSGVLARLVAEGSLLNDPSRTPRGYAFPEWTNSDAED